MREVPGEESILVRTCFSEPEAWRDLQRALVTPSEEGFLPYFAELDDMAWKDAAPGEILALAGELRVVAVADDRALSEPGFPVLVLRREDATTHRVRAIATQLWSIENNLSLFNMDFEEFMEAAGEGGVFRGFQ